MNIEPIIFFDMLAAILILAISLVAVIFYFANTVKKHAEIPDDTQNKTLDITNKSIFKEQVDKISAERINEFEKATSDFMKLYGQVLQELKNKNIEVFQNVSKDIEITTIEEVKSFKDSMEKLTATSQKMVKTKMDTDYETTLKAIHNHKEEEIKKIDNEIYKILEKVSKLVLGKAISLSEHEDLIIKSLEKSKKEGVFEK